MSEKNNIRPYSHYFISVIAVPVLLLITGMVLIYFLTSYFELSWRDRLLGYLAVLGVFLWQRFIVRIKWLELSRGKYMYTEKIKVPKYKGNFSEPAFYEREFSVDTENKMTEMGLGVLLLGLSYFLLSKHDVILPLILFFGGIWFLKDGIKDLTAGPIIKIARTGIWTKESGYLPWTGVKRAFVSDQADSESENQYLEIVLNLKEEERSFNVFVNDIKNFREIQIVIDDFTKDKNQI